MSRNDSKTSESPNSSNERSLTTAGKLEATEQSQAAQQLGE